MPVKRGHVVDGACMCTGPDEPPENVGPNLRRSVAWHPTHGQEGELEADDHVRGYGPQQENDEVGEGERKGICSCVFALGCGCERN